MPIVEFLAIFATWSTPCIRASIGKIQRRITPQLRHQMQTYLSDHLQGIVMPQLAVKNKVHHLQWFRQKSDGDSAVCPEFVIAGMIFHPSRVESELLHKYIEQA